MENKETFQFTYSAKDSAEIENIKKKYLSREIDKMEELRRLDKSVEVPGSVAALVLGVTGTLIFGTGMCCALVWQMYVIAVILGLVGAVVLAFAWPVYKKITEKRKAEITPRILELIKEIEK